MRPTSKLTGPHYVWGQNCDGWRLADTAGLSVIEELMPSGASEVRHHHRQARQFFYVLAGEATMETEHEATSIGPGEGIEIAPGVRHRIRNEGTEPLRFLVISAPSTRGDRINDA